jgi:hypothetical protein
MVDVSRGAFAACIWVLTGVPEVIISGL